MRRPITESAVLAGMGAIPFVVILLILPGDRARATDAFLLFLGAVLMLAFARITKSSAGSPSLLDRVAERPQPEPEPIVELARMERNVVLATARKLDTQHRLRPLLREVAEHRLAMNRGIYLEEDPDAAREVVGSEAWELVRPPEEGPDWRWAPGLRIDELERVVDALEKI